MWRHVASNALTLLIVGLIVGAGILAWAQAQYRAESNLESAICLKVPRGSTMRSVSAELAERGAISSDMIFRLGADYAGKSEALKAGSFLIPAGMPMNQIVETITRSGASTCGTEIVLRIGVSNAQMQVRELDPETNRFVEMAEFDVGAEDIPQAYGEARGDQDTRYRISIAEGATVWQIGNALAAVDFLNNDVTTRPAEGRIAPFGYEVAAGASLSELYAEMTALQDERLADAWRDRADGLPIETPEQALILASIVEKETGLAEERRQVASVFVNRLKQGIRLQSDPTVIYGVTDGQGVLDRGIRQSELRRETPYNTYVIDGLPVGPISNPGLDSIQAVLNPAETDYLFFVADGTGGHAFAETLAEHNANVAKWREIEASQGSD